MKEYRIWGLVNNQTDSLVQLYDPDQDKHYPVPAIFKTRKSAREYIKSVAVGVSTLLWSKVRIKRVLIKGR